MGEQKGKFSDDEILNGIRVHDRDVLEHLYKEVFPLVSSVLSDEGCTDDDVWDVFQETLGAIYSKLVAGDGPMKLNSSFTTFFVAVSKHVWHKHLRRMQADKRYHDEQRSLMKTVELDQMEDHIRDSIRLRLMWRNFGKLKPECRQLIEGIAKGLGASELMNFSPLSSRQAFYNKRRICIERLIQLIKNDPDYFIFKDYEKP
ncbi:MAG: sigma-70 family RNA polymerase sigma factor [Bacteroidetes bacterium]|nr:sigma-70 family RNA polymerase sigma factor [Bacteroidota bacterium]